MNRQNKSHEIYQLLIVKMIVTHRFRIKLREGDALNELVYGLNAPNFWILVYVFHHVFRPPGQRRSVQLGNEAVNLLIDNFVFAEFRLYHFWKLSQHFVMHHIVLQVAVVLQGWTGIDHLTKSLQIVARHLSRFVGAKPREYFSLYMLVHYALQIINLRLVFSLILIQNLIGIPDIILFVHHLRIVEARHD